MAETWPTHYEFPYVTCTQCGNSSSAYGRYNLNPGCDYIERSAFNRFEPPPPQIPTSSCVKPPPSTCKNVGSLTYTSNDYIAPWAINLVNQCNPSSKGTQFEVSRVRYQTL